MTRIRTLLQSGSSYVHDHPQLGMTIALIIVIPVAFLVSGQQFLSVSRENQERLELERVGIMHDMLLTLGKETEFQTEVIGRSVTELQARNPDIVDISLFRAEEQGLRIIASSESGSVGTLAKDTRNFSLSRGLMDESFVIPYAQGGIRYWDSYTYYKSNTNAEYYIYTRTSLAHLDTLFGERVMHAYLWLIGILAVVLFLIFRHMRLIDYAYLYRETKKAIEMKDLFTNMIAHELRAPLTTMRGYASMIREREAVDETTRAHASEIERASERLILIVSDLLDIARIHSGRMTLTRQSFHLSGTIRSVVESLLPLASEKKVNLKIDDPHGKVYMVSDEKRMFQVLTNIVSNALKYTKEGTVTIELHERNDRLELRVKDTGMGISAADQKKLFAPFFRAEGTEMNLITGTGLGMWITKQLVELMGGSIGVESIKGVGTHVVLTLPKGT